jgi:hypothetical protein
MRAIVGRGYNGSKNRKSSSYIGNYVSSQGIVCFLQLISKQQKYVVEFERSLKSYNVLEREEFFNGVMNEISFSDTMSELEACLLDAKEINVVSVNSIEMNAIIGDFYENVCTGCDAYVHTKYKTIDKKVNPVAVALPKESEQKRKKAASESMLRDPRQIGHQFSTESLEQLQVGEGNFLLPNEVVCFKEMLRKHGTKAFAFSSSEIGCVDPSIVEPMVIFTIPHVPWNF